MLEVTYPEANHKCDSEYFTVNGSQYYIFSCPTCGYKRKQWLVPRKKDEILARGDIIAGHYGDAGACEGLAEELMTSMNDMVARIELLQGKNIPVSWK